MEGLLTVKYFEGTPEITKFSKQGNQRNIRIGWPGGFSALVMSVSSEGEEAAVHYLADAPALILSLRRRIEDLEKMLVDAQYKLPPEKPAAIIGVGCIREGSRARDGNPSLYLLNRSEGGWSNFGVRVDGWDDLFRRWDIRVGAPQTDETGQWWPAYPRGA